MNQAAWKEYTGKDPIWCPGCGDFGVLRAMQKAVAGRGLAPHEVVLVTGIGCSGTITSNFASYGFHGLHGRALPVATGIKVAQPERTVLVAGGDGDGFGIGLGHFLHAARRNVDLTYVVMDNQVYGLTKGQTSPTTDAAMTTKASPLGPMAQPLDPLTLAVTGGATFVAQGFSGDQTGLVSLLDRAIAHRGFSFVNIQSPCVTYNLLNTFEWFRTHIRAVPDDHDARDADAALREARAGGVVTGVLFEAERPVFAAKGAPAALAAAADPGRAGREADRLAAWVAAFRAR